MHVHEQTQLPGALVRIQHERPYDYDAKRGIWLYRPVDKVEQVHNLITYTGRVQLHAFCYGTSSRPTGFNYVGLSDDSAAPDVGDVALAAELTLDGLGRSQGTVFLPSGVENQTTVQCVFTYTGTSQSAQKTALFDAVSDGTMNHEIQFTQRTLLTNDTLTITFILQLGLGAEILDG